MGCTNMKDARAPANKVIPLNSTARTQGGEGETLPQKNLSALPSASVHSDQMQQGKAPQVQKHYVPKMKQRVKETVAMKESKDGEGKKMLNNYVFLNTLGKGSYGKVKLAVKRQDEREDQFAVKILKKSFLKRKREYYRDSGGAMKFKDALDSVKREIAIMKKLIHPNVIKLYEVIENPDNDKLYMILDYAQGGQLIEWDEDDEKFFFCNQQQEEPYSEQYLRGLFRGCLKGIHFLHQNGIIHRDIKPQNILLDKEGNPKIADFGVSAVTTEDDKVQGSEGTYFFMPPEALSKETNKEGYKGKKADIWSLGVTFFCFTFLELPFKGANLVEIFDVIKQQDLTFPTHRECSDGLKKLFSMMISKDPNVRASIEDIADNAWINEGYATPLSKELQKNADIVTEVNQQELENAFQISTFVKIKSWVARWKGNHPKEKGDQSPVIDKK